MLRIIGGRNARKAQFPYLVRIKLSDDPLSVCAGSILTDRLILTAAHCVAHVPSHFISVEVGHVELGKGKPYAIKEVLTPKDFSPNNFERDVALMKTKAPITFNQNVKPIALGNFKVPSSVNGQVMGWGMVTRGSEPSQILNYVTVTTINEQECVDALPRNMGRFIDKTHLCTKKSFLSGVCYGDSGGPLVINNAVVGIVSFNVPCSQGYPDVYTRISYYYDWIVRAMKDHK